MALNQSCFCKKLFGFGVTCLTLVFSLFVIGADVGQVPNLYSQVVQVAGKDKNNQEEAMKQAFEEIVLKVSGRREVFNYPEIMKAMNNPESYVREYQFRKGLGDEKRNQYLQVTFDSKALNLLLRDAGVPVWGSNRPTTIVWLAVDNYRRRDLLGEEDVLSQAIISVFKKRGLPVIFPMHDIEDARTVSKTDVWGGFSSKIMAASQRYDTDSILYGNLGLQGERYRGRITFLLKGDRYQVSIDEQNSDDVANIGADLVADILSRHYGISANVQDKSVNVLVNNVKTIEDYEALTRYLLSLTAVREVKTGSISGTVVVLQLMIDGTIEQLVDALNMGRNLRPNRSEERNGKDDESKLSYSWVDRNR